MILIIDNYDSFVYNLARYVGELNFKRRVIRNDKISLEEIKKINPSHIIISPGPGAPNQAGISLELIKKFYKKIPILGICLGHQAIGQVFGGKIVKAIKPMHGKASLIHHDEKNIFLNIENPLKVARYHSLIVNEETLSSELLITARSGEGEIMALQHKIYPVVGLQFHPESILTQQGYDLLRNFLR